MNGDDSPKSRSSNSKAAAAAASSLICLLLVWLAERIGGAGVENSVRFSFFSGAAGGG